VSYLILGIFGLAIGSFMNVVALRYDGDHFLLNPKVIGGRSHCPHCKKILEWYELIPVVSWIVQRARCRGCGVRIGWQYPFVELLSALIFIAVPWRFSFATVTLSQALLSSWSLPWSYTILSAVWIIVCEILLLIAYIDILLGIIPDELNIALLVLGAFDILFLMKTFGIGNPSFFGMHASAFGLQSNIWINHLIAALVGGACFGILVLITKGRGMGLGDVKLAVPLGLLFGWPDILIIIGTSFILGGIFGTALILSRRKSMKSAIPFGPFLAIASVAAFFWGSWFFNGYFHLIGL
jgi:prepilin signal peptidase PulO-like enzyme (type II secretory pathway)